MQVYECLNFGTMRYECSLCFFCTRFGGRVPAWASSGPRLIAPHAKLPRGKVVRALLLGAIAITET